LWGPGRAAFRNSLGRMVASQVAGRAAVAWLSGKRRLAGRAPGFRRLVSANEPGRDAGGSLDSAGRHPCWPVPALVGAVAAGDPGPGELSGAHALSAGDWTLVETAHRFQYRLHRAHADGNSMVHLVQRDRRRVLDSLRSSRSVVGVWLQPSAALAATLCA